MKRPDHCRCPPDRLRPPDRPRPPDRLRPPRSPSNRAGPSTLRQRSPIPALAWRRPMVARVLALLVGCCLAVGATAPAAAHATTPQERRALALTTQAKAAFKGGQYQQAAMLFQQAYAQVPEPTLLYNAARAYQKGEFLREALSMFRLYLTLATYNDEETREGRAEAVQHIAVIDKALQRQAEERARSAREAAARGPSTTQPPATQPPATQPGVRQGPPVAVRGPMILKPPTARTPVRRPGLFSRVSQKGWSEREIAAVSLMGGGAAVVLTGVILHAVASSTLSGLDADMAARRSVRGGVTFYSGVSQKAAQDAIDSHNGLRLGGNMLLGLGAVAVGVGGWLWMSRRAGEDNKLSLAPSFGPAGFGWSMQGSF